MKNLKKTLFIFLFLTISKNSPANTLSLDQINASPNIAIELCKQVVGEAYGQQFDENTSRFSTSVSPSVFNVPSKTVTNVGGFDYIEACNFTFRLNTYCEWRTSDDEDSGGSQTIVFAEREPSSTLGKLDLPSYFYTYSAVNPNSGDMNQKMEFDAAVMNAAYFHYQVNEYWNYPGGGESEKVVIDEYFLEPNATKEMLSHCSGFNISPITLEKQIDGAPAGELATVTVIQYCHASFKSSCVTSSQTVDLQSLAPTPLTTLTGNTVLTDGQTLLNKLGSLNYGDDSTLPDDGTGGGTGDGTVSIDVSPVVNSIDQLNLDFNNFANQTSSNRHVEIRDDLLSIDTSVDDLRLDLAAKLNTSNTLLDDIKSSINSGNTDLSTKISSLQTSITSSLGDIKSLFESDGTGSTEFNTDSADSELNTVVSDYENETETLIDGLRQSVSLDDNLIQLNLFPATSYPVIPIDLMGHVITLDFNSEPLNLIRYLIITVGVLFNISAAFLALRIIVRVD